MYIRVTVCEAPFPGFDERWWKFNFFLKTELLAQLGLNTILKQYTQYVTSLLFLKQIRLNF
jgi:hypothetical protein